MAANRLIDDFIARCEDEAPKLAKALDRLDDKARPALAEVLTCFDYKRTGTLDDDERPLARRVLTLLHRPSVTGLQKLSSVLEYLHANATEVLAHNDVVLAVEILEMFCEADSVNQTLSVRELDMLLAVLAHLDAGGSGALDHAARSHLRDSLWDPNEFLDEQKQVNPKLRALLGLE